MPDMDLEDYDDEDFSHDPLEGMERVKSFPSQWDGTCNLKGCDIKRKSLVHIVTPEGAMYPLEGVACDACGSVLPRQGSSRTS